MTNREPVKPSGPTRTIKRSSASQSATGPSGLKAGFVAVHQPARQSPPRKPNAN
jgi:hypothetical protein